MTASNHAAQQQAFPAEPPIDATALDALRELQEDGEPDFLAELVELFVSAAGPHLVALRHGVEQGEAVLVERSAHALKGSCGHFGARPMGDLCERLQVAGRAGTQHDAPALVDRLEHEFERVRTALEAELARDDS
jgi:HPt (histidine-containing phosphotransfer) domain-containing protein